MWHLLADAETPTMLTLLISMAGTIGFVVRALWKKVGLLETNLKLHSEQITNLKMEVNQLCAELGRPPRYFTPPPAVSPKT